MASQEGALDYLATSAALQQFKQVGPGLSERSSGNITAKPDFAGLFLSYRWISNN